MLTALMRASGDACGAFTPAPTAICIWLPAGSEGGAGEGGGRGAVFSGGTIVLC